jgi:uncharacterized protein (TIGR02996 family)
MNEEVPFLKAMLALPGDSVTRLVYSDWLEERNDPRGEFLRLDTELLSANAELSKAQSLRLVELRHRLDPAWLAFLSTMGQPFRETPPEHPIVEYKPENTPFTDRLGSRGHLATFASQFCTADAWDETLILDIRSLVDIPFGNCFYGATDWPLHPFLCEWDSQKERLTAADILAALKARHFQSDHISDLDVTSIPYPGYHPSTNNDEIHNTYGEQYLFDHDENSEEDEIHIQLKSLVRHEQLWYVNLHPTKENGYAPLTVLLAVGQSPSMRRLLGVITCQVCHNLCD